MSKYRNYCFTLNNPTPEDEVYLQGVACKYIKYGRECGASGTPHLQGMIIWNAQKTETAARKLLKRCHVEVMLSLTGSMAYVEKDGDVFENGTPPQLQSVQGEKEISRWKDARLAAGEDRLDDIPDDIRFKCYSAVEHFRSIGAKARHLPDTETQHLWYYGRSGTGKSRKARTDFPEAYLKMCNKWWDGYTDEKTVLIEDLDKHHDKLCHHLKIWGDRYPFLAEHKGGARKIRPDLVIITSNYHPNQIWGVADLVFLLLCGLLSPGLPSPSL